MSNYITAESGELKCDIGKKSEEGYVNITCYFNPLRLTGFIESLDRHAPPVEFVSNVQRYDNDFGGMSVRLKKNYSVLDLQECLAQMFSRMET